MSEQSTRYQIQLRDKLVAHYNDDEIRSLCFDLGIDYEGLSGDGKQAKVRELIGYLQRTGRIVDLLQLVMKQRPNVNWHGEDENAMGWQDTSTSSPATLQAGFTNWIDISDRIVNPGFEDGFLGWKEDSSVINSEQAASRSIDDATEARSGTHSRKLFLREGGSYIKQIINLNSLLPSRIQIRLGAHIKMPFSGDTANKWFTLMLITHGGSSDQIEYVQMEQFDTVTEWTKVTTHTKLLHYPVHKLEIHALTTKGGGAHKGFDKPVWVDDFTIEYRSLES